MGTFPFKDDLVEALSRVELLQYSVKRSS